MSDEDFENQLDEKEQESLRAEQYKADFEWLMGDPRGRRIMYQLIERSNMYHAPLLEDNENHYLSGQRMVGLSFYADIIDFNLEEMLFKMQREAKEPL